MKKNIPNAITSANLLCGCLAITQIAEGAFMAASLLVLLGAFFDFFDGMAARLLKVSSRIGAELDSLADVVTFGVVPAYLTFSWLNNLQDSYLNYLAFSIAVFSALRLAKFNVDERQTTSFIGLPTPANALFWISLPLISWQMKHNFSLLQVNEFRIFMESPHLLIASALLFSFLLVAELPLLSLKFNSLSWKGNEFRFLLLAISLILISLFFFAAIPIILLLYIVLSIIQTSFNKPHEIQS